MTISPIALVGQYRILRGDLVEEDPLNCPHLSIWPQLWAKDFSFLSPKHPLLTSALNVGLPRAEGEL